MYSCVVKHCSLSLGKGFIDRQNNDNQNALLGFNWDINKRLLWSAEYNGFTEFHDAFISSLIWKY